MEISDLKACTDTPVENLLVARKQVRREDEEEVGFDPREAPVGTRLHDGRSGGLGLCFSSFRVRANVLIESSPN